MVKGNWNISKKAEQLRMQNPFGDFDRDRVPNLLDCQPFNPNEHGWIGDTWKSIQQRVTTAVTPTYKRVTSYVKPYVAPIITTVPKVTQVVKKYTYDLPETSYEVAERRRKKRREAVKEIYETKDFAKIIPTRVIPKQIDLRAKAITPVLKRKVIKPIRAIGDVLGTAERAWEREIVSPVIGKYKAYKTWERERIGIPTVSVPQKEYVPPLRKPLKKTFGTVLGEERFARMEERYGKPPTGYEITPTTLKEAGERFTRLISEPTHTVIGGKKQEEIVKQEKATTEAYKKTEKLVKPEWVQPSGEILLPIKLTSKAIAAKDKIATLANIGKNKGWQKPDGNFVYSDTPEGREWAGKYESAINKQRSYVTSEGYYKKEYIEYTPAAQKYVDTYKSYESEQAKLEAMPKPHIARRLGMGFGTMLISVPGFVAFEAPRIAAETVIKPTAAPGKLVGFGKEMHEFAKEKPVEFAGSVAAMWTLGGFKGAPVKPKIQIAKLPKAKAISIGVETVKTPGLFKKGGYGEYYPGLTIGKGGIKRVSIGKPKVKGEIFGDKPIEITSPFEARLAVAAIPVEAAKIVESRAVLHYIVKAGVKPKELRPIIDETLKRHGLTKSTNTIINLLKKEKADLHGSIMQEAATRRFGITRRTPRDFDVKVADKKRFARNVIREINKAESREAVVLSKKGNIIIKKTEKKLFDIHAKEAPGEYGSILGEDYIGLGMKEEPYITTAEGLKTTTLLRQTTRKFTAAQTIAGRVREFPMGIGKTAEVFRGMKYTSKLKSKILKGHPKGDKSIISGGTDRLQFHHIVKTGKGEAGVLMTYKEHLAIETAMGRIGPAIGKDTLFYKLFRERPALTSKEIQNIIKYGKSKQVRNEINYILKEIKTREIGIEPFKIKGRIMPEHKGRVKDIADAYFNAKAMIAGDKLKGRLIAARQAEIHLDRWLDSWGKDVKVHVKDLYAKTLKKEGGEKAWLGSFEEIPISGSQSYKIVSQIRDVSYIPSAIPSSIITPSSLLTSRIPSRISIIPSAIPSKILPPSIMPSFAPSKVSKIGSELSSIMGISKAPPSKIVSKPIITPSKIPVSKTPTSVSISKVPSIPISKISISKTPPSKPVIYVPPSILIPPPPTIKRKVKKKKIPIRRIQLGAYKYGEKTPVAMPEEALGLLGVGTVEKGKYVYNPKDAAGFLSGE